MELGTGKREPGTGNMEQEKGRVRPDQEERGFRRLLAWQKADDLAAEVFRLTEKEIDARHRWLSLQIIRAAFSVTANISEGYGRSTLADYSRFLEVAGASLNEVENALHFIRRNGVLAPESLAAAEELRRATGNLLFGLARSLRSKLTNKEGWQRGLVREQSEDYEPNTWVDSMFQVPGSEFQDQTPGSQFQDPEAHYD